MEMIRQNLAEADAFMEKLIGDEQIVRGGGKPPVIHRAGENRAERRAREKRERRQAKHAKVAA